jgi:hypothetical protein
MENRTLTEGRTFNELVMDIVSLLAGLELTDEEGEALIHQIRVRMRRPTEAVPSAAELAKGLGALMSCFSIPASDKIHAVNVVRPVNEVEAIYCDCLDLMRRFYQP